MHKVIGHLCLKQTCFLLSSSLWNSCEVELLSNFSGNSKLNISLSAATQYVTVDPRDSHFLLSIVNSEFKSDFISSSLLINEAACQSQLSV